jgi:hypothetical protein
LRYDDLYPHSVRYLTRAFAIGALSRGNEIEQFIGPIELAGARGIRWVSVWPWESGYNVSVHDVEDLGDENFLDLSEFPPLDPDGEEVAGLGREVARSTDETEAIELAEKLTGARADRWVNFGMAGEDYADLLRARRRAGK